MYMYMYVHVHVYKSLLHIMYRNDHQFILKKTMYMYMYIVHVHAYHFCIQVYFVVRIHNAQSPDCATPPQCTLVQV